MKSFCFNADDLQYMGDFHGPLSTHHAHTHSPHSRADPTILFTFNYFGFGSLDYLPDKCTHTAQSHLCKLDASRRNAFKSKQMPGDHKVAGSGEMLSFRFDWLECRAQMMPFIFRPNAEPNANSSRALQIEPLNVPRCDDEWQSVVSTRPIAVRLRSFLIDTFPWTPDVCVCSQSDSFHNKCLGTYDRFSHRKL